MWGKKVDCKFTEIIDARLLKPILNDDEGFYQIGPPEHATDKFMLSVTVAFAANLVQVCVRHLRGLILYKLFILSGSVPEILSRGTVIAQWMVMQVADLTRTNVSHLNPHYSDKTSPNINTTLKMVLGGGGVGSLGRSVAMGFHQFV